MSNVPNAFLSVFLPRYMNGLHPWSTSPILSTRFFALVFLCSVDTWYYPSTKAPCITLISTLLFAIHRVSPHILLRVLYFVILRATQKYLAFMARKGGDGAAKGRASTSTFHLMQLDNAIAFATGVPSRLDPSRLFFIDYRVNRYRITRIGYHHFAFILGEMFSYPSMSLREGVAVPGCTFVRWLSLLVTSKSVDSCYWVTSVSQPTKLATIISR